MGNCMSNNCRSSDNTKKRKKDEWPPRAMLISMDGSIEEFYEPVKVQRILEDKPSHFVCSADCLYVGQHISRLLPDQEIQLGQLYFLLPLRKLQFVVSDSDMASLLLKANTAINRITGSGRKSRSKIQPLFDILLLRSDDGSEFRQKLLSEELSYGNQDSNSSECAGKRWKSKLDTISESV